MTDFLAGSHILLPMGARVGSESSGESAAIPARYHLICPLASGGMADLHLARMTGVAGFERLVVVKRLRQQLADSPELAQMLLDEARIAATLQHGNIVQVHDVEIRAGTVSMIMEYLHGHDVRTVMRRARERLPERILPLGQSIAIALGVAAGLHHAHGRVDAAGRALKIVHRDISPENVFVTYDGGVKIIDFGIASAQSRMGRTDQGIVKGKPGYMAPEQILGRPLDRRTDVYGLTVLLYEMTTGQRPHDEEGPYQLASAVVERDPRPPSDVMPGYPDDLERIIMRGLAREPAARQPNALEFMREVDAFARPRRLDLSPFQLAQVMEQIFAAELDAWHVAQSEGRTLVEHVAALRGSGVSQALGEAAPSAPAGGAAAFEAGAEANPPGRPKADAELERRRHSDAHRPEEAALRTGPAAAGERAGPSTGIHLSDERHRRHGRHGATALAVFALAVIAVIVVIRSARDARPTPLPGSEAPASIANARPNWVSGVADAGPKPEPPAVESPRAVASADAAVAAGPPAVEEPNPGAAGRRRKARRSRGSGNVHRPLEQTHPAPEAAPDLPPERPLDPDAPLPR